MMTLGYNTAGTEETFENVLNRALSLRRDDGEPFRYLEIGIAEGTALLSVARHVENRIPYWQVDGVDLYGGPFFNAQKFLEQSSGLNVQITYTGAPLHIATYTTSDVSGIGVNLLKDGIRLSPEHLQKDSLHFAVIDGCHGAPCVERDFLAIEQAIKRGGIVAFHDAMPDDQGGEPGTNGWQSHCGTGIAVNRALHHLGLLYGQANEISNLSRCTGARDGWTLEAFVRGDKSRGGNGFAFFRKV